MKFDITELDLAEVMVVLHTAARVSNTTFLDNKAPVLTHRIARELIEEAQESGNLIIDRLMGRAMHINLNDDLVDLTRYEMNNGTGVGIRALYKLCQNKNVEAKVVRDDEGTVIVTDLWLSNYSSVVGDPRKLAVPGYPTVDADKVAWQARWDAASEEERKRMIDDDSIKYSYPTQLTGLADAIVGEPSAANAIGAIDLDLPRLEDSYFARKQRLLHGQAAEVLADDNRMAVPLRFLGESEHDDVMGSRGRGERMLAVLAQADNSDRDLLGLPRQEDLTMAVRMQGDQLVSIDVVAGTTGRASDLNTIVDLSKPSNEGFGQ